jgi:hypothetical protein
MGKEIEDLDSESSWTWTGWQPGTKRTLYPMSTRERRWSGGSGGRTLARRFRAWDDVFLFLDSTIWRRRTYAFPCGGPTFFYFSAPRPRFLSSGAVTPTSKIPHGMWLLVAKYPTTETTYKLYFNTKAAAEIVATVQKLIFVSLSHKSHLFTILTYLRLYSCTYQIV